MAETNQTPPPGGVFSFLLGASLWGGGFALAVILGPKLPLWPREFAFFLTACVLLGLSFAFIIGASRLALHRTAYLVVGLLATFLISQAANPLVNRTRLIDANGRYAGAHLLLTLGMAQTLAGSSPPAVETRNIIYGDLGKFLEEALPEPILPTFCLGLTQLLLASGIGLWIGSGIDKASHLIPVALVAGLADIWSVSAGATAIIIQSPTIHYFLLHFPRLGGGEFSMPYLIGLTDFLFFAIFFQSAIRFELGQRKNFLLLGAAFILAILSVTVFAVGLPVLPFMAVFFVVGNYRHLKMTSEDFREMVIFCLGVAATWFLFSRLAGR